MKSLERTHNLTNNMGMTSLNNFTRHCILRYIAKLATSDSFLSSRTTLDKFKLFSREIIFFIPLDTLSKYSLNENLRFTLHNSIPHRLQSRCHVHPNHCCN